jgi:transcriptional regulator of acetoin/glycerol metabolism
LAAPARQALADDAELKRLAATFGGTRLELARQLGLSERTLYRRLKSLGLA